MIDISELLQKKKIAEKCAAYMKSVDDEQEYFHLGYAQALREVICELSPLTLVQDDIANETKLAPEDRVKAAFIVTPKKTIATLVHVLNQSGELGTEFEYTGNIIYRDANDDHWIEVDGEVLPFNIELLELIKDK